MKAISIKQLLASLIAHDIKDIEKNELLFYFCVFSI